MNGNCEKCDGKCCKYVILEIDTPETKKDFEDIKWFVCHKNVNVFVDDEDNWNLEFLTPCEFLGEKNECKIYEGRPKICRRYDTKECLFHNKGYSQKYTFEKIEDVEKYVKEIFNKRLHELPEEEE